MSMQGMRSNGIMNTRTLVVFALDEPRYALYADSVVIVIPALEIIPLPGAPEIVLGVINLHGELLPVMDVRSRFRLPARVLDVDDQFIVVRTASRRLVFPVDRVTDVRKINGENAVDTTQTLPFEDYLSGIIKLDGDIVLIHDVDAFLSMDEERLLSEVLNAP
jgi:purine-binding chemotaxis protein CheW